MTLLLLMKMIEESIMHSRGQKQAGYYPWDEGCA